jgi:phosphoribosylaminoimidazole-succinocarboxamide synthase
VTSTQEALPDRAPDVEGRSKRVWIHDDHTCTVELVPSLRSFTYGRDEMIDRTDELRLDFYEAAATRLRREGVPTVFRERLSPRAYLADYAPGPPVEVIVKNRAVGSTTRKYPGLFEEGTPFTPPVVKFDYRTEPEDQPIGEDYLRHLGIAVERWRDAALQCNQALRAWLRPADLWDICFVMGHDVEDRLTISSEISPDCMRLRDVDGTPLDKDLFRQGASAEQLVSVWARLAGSVTP